MAGDPREPLSPEEAALARVYATLPGGEPPAALDARVLAQARAAVAPARSRSRPWFLMPGVGAAAAAVMAAGLAWQLGWLGEAQLPGATQAPQSESVAPAATPKPKEEEEKQRVDIDYAVLLRMHEQQTVLLFRRQLDQAMAGLVDFTELIGQAHTDETPIAGEGP